MTPRNLGLPFRTWEDPSGRGPTRLDRCSVGRGGPRSPRYPTSAPPGLSDAPGRGPSRGAGQTKTDAGDAAIIAEAARTMPHTLCALALDDEPIGRTKHWPNSNSECSAGSTTTWPGRSLRHPIGSMGCSARLILFWNELWARNLITTRPWRICLPVSDTCSTQHRRRGHVRATVEDAPRAAEAEGPFSSHGPELDARHRC